jgi:hypothetical protein
VSHGATRFGFRISKSNSRKQIQDKNRNFRNWFPIGLSYLICSSKTAEDFGLQGEPPSHPELLDWLATEFIRTGWDMKAMHRLIVTSAAYRQASRVRAELLKDPENRLLARGPRVRLAAEGIRDNALAISGLLVEKLGGPPVKPYQPEGLWAELGGGAPTPYVQDKGANLYRRSLYIFRKRTVPHPILATFDAPSREICQVKRQRTNTPLQALALLNDITYVEAARHLAQRLLKEGGKTPRPPRYRPSFEALALRARAYIFCARPRTTDVGARAMPRSVVTEGQACKEGKFAGKIRRFAKKDFDVSS